MVVLSTLAFLAVNSIFDREKAPTKGELVNIVMENERWVGVNSGGCVCVSTWSLFVVALCFKSTPQYLVFFT